MLGSNCSCWAVEASEYNSSTENACAHVRSFSTAVDDMIDSLKGEVPCHVLNDGLESHERGSNGKSSETSFSDWCVSDSVSSVLINKALCDFVGTLILPNFLTDDKSFGIVSQLFIKGRVQSLSIGDGLGKESTDIFGYCFQHFNEVYFEIIMIHQDPAV